MDKEEAALNSLNAIRVQRGKTPFKKFPKSNGNRKQRSSTQDDKWGADEVQILREVWTHAEGMLQTDQRKRSNDHRARQTVQSQWSNQEDSGRHLSLRLFGFKLCAGRTVVPSLVPDISDVKTTPQFCLVTIIWIMSVRLRSPLDVIWRFEISCRKARSGVMVEILAIQSHSYWW